MSKPECSLNIVLLRTIHWSQSAKCMVPNLLIGGLQGWINHIRGPHTNVRRGSFLICGARIFSVGALFFPEKVLRPFLVVVMSSRLDTTNGSNVCSTFRHQNSVVKHWQFRSWLGAHGGGGRTSKFHGTTDTMVNPALGACAPWLCHRRWGQTGIVGAAALFWAARIFCPPSPHSPTFSQLVPPLSASLLYFNICGMILTHFTLLLYYELD